MSEPANNSRHCSQCGREFRMFMRRPRTTTGARDVPARSVSIHYIDLDGYFCTLRCAARYGTAAAKRPALAKAGAS